MNMALYMRHEQNKWHKYFNDITLVDMQAFLWKQKCMHATTYDVKWLILINNINPRVRETFYQLKKDG